MDDDWYLRAFDARHPHNVWTYDKYNIEVAMFSIPDRFQTRLLVTVKDGAKGRGVQGEMFVDDRDSALLEDMLNQYIRNLINQLDGWRPKHENKRGVLQHLAKMARAVIA